MDNEVNILYVVNILYAPQQKGLVRHVGACNFDTVRLQQMKDSGVTFATSQVQYSMMDRRAEVLMAPYCLRNNIAMIPYGVLAGGFLSDRYVRFPEGRYVFFCLLCLACSKPFI